jgi:hypothetical protein
MSRGADATRIDAADREILVITNRRRSSTTESLNDE